MRRCVVALAAFLVLMPGIAGANYLGDVQTDRGVQAWLAHDNRVNVSFSYKVDDPAGARIMVLPYSNGSPSPSYAWQGSPLYPQGDGWGTSWCRITSGDRLVDQIQITLWTEDWSELLLELFLPVEYHYSAKGVTDLWYSHSTPSWIQYDERLDITHHFTTDEPGYIYARPYYDGELVSGYGASGSPLILPPGDFVDHYFYFGSGPKDVNQIRYYQYNEELTEIIWECFMPVEYHWEAHGLSNFVFNFESKEWLSYDEHLTVNFNYSTSDPNGVRVWALGAEDGAIDWPGMYYQGSVLLPWPGGFGERFFGYNQDQETNQVGFLMSNDDQSETYLQVFIPFDATFRAHSINHVSYQPGAPAILDFEEQIDCGFHYYTTGANSLRIWPHPFAQGNSIPHWYSGSPLYSPVEDWGTSYFGYDGPDDVLIDQVQFRMRDDTNEEILVEAFAPALHFYGHSAVATAIPEENPVAATELFASYPNPFNPKTTLNFNLAQTGQVQLGVFDVQGRHIKVLLDERKAAGPHAIEWDGTNAKGERMASGVYLAKFVSEDLEMTHKMILMK